jgi:putative membrane protein
MESERIESDSEEPEIGPQSESVVERPLWQSAFEFVKSGITSNYVKSLGLILAFFKPFMKTVKFYSQFDFDEKKLDAYLDKSTAIQCGYHCIFCWAAY